MVGNSWLLRSFCRICFFDMKIQKLVEWFPAPDRPGELGRDQCGINSTLECYHSRGDLVWRGGWAQGFGGFGILLETYPLAMECSVVGLGDSFVDERLYN